MALCHFTKVNCKSIEKKRNKRTDVQNISYFCIVKRFKTILRALCLLFLLLAGIEARAEASAAQTGRDQASHSMDSVTISLLTCSPEIPIYGNFGHTALRIQDLRTGEDVVVNYGLFDKSKPYFVLRFVFGLCDYTVGVEPFETFLSQYAFEGRGVIQQNIRLSGREKLAILQALNENLKEENRVYRYNFFYDNCTTRARDMIVDHMRGKVDYHFIPDEKPTWRQMTHQWTAVHRWNRFGEDLLLGLKADFEASHSEQQFLPDSLRKDFARATVVHGDAAPYVLGPKGDSVLSTKPYALVDTTIVLLSASQPETDFTPGYSTKGFWDHLTPRLLFAILLVIVAAIEVVEVKRRRAFWVVDAVLLSVSGLAGVLLFAMIFSLHPTVSINLQILCLNPLNLVFVYPALRDLRRGKMHIYWSVYSVCLLLFFGGALFQDYAEGMLLFGLIMVSRCVKPLGARRDHQPGAASTPAFSRASS